MLNESLVKLPIGPNGEFGEVDLAVVNGKLVQTTTVSPAALLNSLAKRLPGGVVPAEVATFIETALGLA